MNHVPSVLLPVDARARANGEQRLASDPTRSAFVAANAGSGKTRVLTDRLLRLMLVGNGGAGADPGRIQCLTFTKAAAAEMAIRLQRRLGEWVTLSDAALDTRLIELGVLPGNTTRTRARALFALILDLPGGMRIGTIHAFCQSLLRRFPLEAAISPQFRLMEDADARAALAAAREEVLAAADPAAVGDLPGLLTAERFAALVGALLASGSRLNDLLRLPDPAVPAALRRAVGVQAGSERALLDAAATWPAEAAMRDALRLVDAHGTDAARRRALDMLAWLGTPPPARPALWDGWVAGLLTAAGTPRAGNAFANKRLAESHPTLLEAVAAEQARVIEVEEQRRAVRVAAASAGLLGLALPVLRAYAAHKQRTGMLDYGDLIGRSDALLRDPGAAWVLYKLDGGMDHLLLDEVQDTAPEQWRIAHTLTEEFFAGLGAADVERTFFAVGDLKQSIYSFQGADPEEFGRSRAEMRRRVEGAGAAWRDVQLDVSFRSTAPVLQLVDAVFAEGPARDGVVSADGQVEHYADRADQAGRVELWPLAPVPDTPTLQPWTVPDRNEGLVSAPQRLADGIATWLREQLNDGALLESQGRPLRAGDVLVLVRRRGDFARALVRALKARGVAVAGLDRLVLTEQAAVQDILALCDTLLLPQDDLQLACVLTSPLGGLTDDSLMRLAMGRPGTLWDALRARAGERAAWQKAWHFLSTLLSRTDHVTPHALISEALGPLGGRARLFARLGPEAAEPVDELLGAAMHYSAINPPSLQGFVHWLRRQAAEIKRQGEPAGGAVRVMTVHGAKGLEAPLVILPDTTGEFGQEDEVAWLRDPQTGIDLPLWSPRKELRSARVRDSHDAARRRRQAEHNRLLYVALTRAEDRLIVCGWQSRRPQPDSWYDLVRQGFERLGARAEPFDDITGTWSGDRLVFDSPQRGPVVTRTHANDPTPSAKLPAWAGAAPDWVPSPLPAEPKLPVPLAPSRPDGAALGPVPSMRSPLESHDPRRYLRGRITHQLLQHLPTLPEADRAEAAHRYAAQPGFALPPDAADALATEVLAVLRHPDLDALFGPGSRAEQPMTGLVAGHVVNGIADRLAVLPDQVLVADYKTNRDPPADAAGTPVAYLRQMAAYRAVLRGIYPGRPVRCALVWTERCQVVPLPDALLDGYGPQGAAAA